MTHLRVYLSVLILTIIAFPAFARDCTSLKDPSEAKDCLEVELREANATVESTYYALRAKLDESGKASLAQGQQAWIDTRNRGCGIDSGHGDREAWLRNILQNNAKAACVARITRQRGEQLTRYLAAVSAGAGVAAQNIPPAKTPGAPAAATAQAPQLVIPAPSTTRAQPSDRDTPSSTYSGYSSSSRLSEALKMIDMSSLVLGVVSSAALTVTALFGLWGIAGSVAALAAIVCVMTGGIPEPAVNFFLAFGLMAILLVIMRIVIRRTLYPLSTRRLVRGLPLVTLAFVLLVFLFLAGLVSVLTDNIPFESIALNTIVVGIIQLIVGYLVVVPAYLWFGRRTEKAAMPPDALAADAPAVPADRPPAVKQPASAPAVAAKPAPARSGYVEANYGVPHTNFRRTDDGFTLTFRQTGESLFKLTSAAAGGGGFLALLVLSVILVVWYIIDALFSTTISVDTDSITVAGRRMRREDFGTFSVHHTLTVGKYQRAVLGYSYGRQSFAFGGVWEPEQASEVASALNRELRAVPSAADEYRVSADTLRTIRPTDF